MMTVQPYRLKFLSLIAIALLLPACGPRKVAQCNALITSMNEVKAISDNYQSIQTKLAIQAKTVRNYDQQQKLLENSLGHTRNIVREYERAMSQVNQTPLKNSSLLSYKASLMDVYTRQIQAIKQLHDTVSELSNADIPQINNTANTSGSPFSDAELRRISASMKAETSSLNRKMFPTPEEARAERTKMARENQAKVQRVKQSIAALKTQAEELQIEESGIVARVNAYCGAPKSKKA